MKLLLDESVPKVLGFELERHFVRAVQVMGWSGLSNGRLLAVMAENAFELLVTCGQNIEYQQNAALPVAGCCSKSNKSGAWIPFVNDCYNVASRCLDKYLPGANPGGPGRFNTNCDSCMKPKTAGSK